jgi:hypothetical protein
MVVKCLVKRCKTVKVTAKAKQLEKANELLPMDVKIEKNSKKNQDRIKIQSPNIESEYENAKSVKTREPEQEMAKQRANPKKEVETSSRDQRPNNIVKGENQLGVNFERWKPRSGRPC